jgi:magnesium-transporting ATPase (P-type)
VLSFGAISVCASARFSTNSAFHARSFRGNPLALWSYIIMSVLQVFITYTPGLNTTIFNMKPMDGWQWGVVALGMVIVFVVMETEKAICRYLTTLKYDTADREVDELFDAKPEIDKTPLPDEVQRFGHAHLQH